MILIPESINKIEIIHAKNSDLPIFIDAEDYNRVSKINWFIHSTRQISGREFKIKCSPVLLHRFILNLTRKDREVDHIDRNFLNNTKINFRFSNASLNALNQEKRSGNFSSKYIGVHFYKPLQKWKSTVTENGKKIHLGYFKTEEEAARERDKFMIKYYLKYTVLNFPLSSYNI